MAKDQKGHGSDERAYRKEQRDTYKAGRAEQTSENRKIMGPTTGKTAQNMRDLVRAKIADGEKAAAAKRPSDYHAVAGKVQSGTPSVGKAHVETPEAKKERQRYERAKYAARRK